MSYKAQRNGGGESYSGIVPAKRSNEGRGGAKETVGGKAVDQGEHGRAQLVPDAETGKRAKRAGPCATNSQAGPGSTVPSPAAPRQYGSAAQQLLQPEEASGGGSGWHDATGHDLLRRSRLISSRLSPECLALSPPSRSSQSGPRRQGFASPLPLVAPLTAPGRFGASGFFPEPCISRRAFLSKQPVLTPVRCLPVVRLGTKSRRPADTGSISARP